MKYCKKCLMPDTKPALKLNKEGVCSACVSYENRAKVDWSARKQEFEEILSRYRSNGSHYDCIVPVSGGKDSTYMVWRLLQHGMTPLCVTATTCDLSETGRRNITNLQRLGVDHIEYTTNPVARRKINKYALQEVGDISWPEHASIFTVPVNAAVNYKVPLIVWGENSQDEYGGPAAARKRPYLDKRWLDTFGGLLGLKVEDLLKIDGITPKDLIPYTYPSDAALAEVGVTGLFLGHYIPWDGYTNNLISQMLGVTTHPTHIENSAVNYENLDNLQTGVHDYFCFLKYGYGRATAQLCLSIRRGRITREDAKVLLKGIEGKFPWTYMGVRLEDILDRIDMSMAEFKECCNRFTNWEIFKSDADCSPVQDRYCNLTLKDEEEDEEPEPQKAATA